MHHQFSHPQFSYLSPLNMQCTAQVKNKVSHVSFALFTLLIFSPCSNSSVFHSHIFFFLLLCRLWRTSLPSAWPSITPINLPSYSTCPLERKGGELREEGGVTPSTLVTLQYSGHELWRATPRALSTLTHNPFCLTWIQYISMCIHSNRNNCGGRVFFPFFFFFVCSFVFLNKVFTWRCRAKGHEVCQIHDFQGEVYSFLSCLSSS